MTSSRRRRSVAAPSAIDVVLTAVVLVLSVADVAAVSANEQADRPADWLAYLLVTIGSLALLWRRRAPVAVLAVVVAVLAVVYLREYGAFLSVMGLPALYAVAAHEPDRRRAWWAMIGGSVVLLIVASISLLDTDDGFRILTLLSMTAFLAAAIAAGVVVRHREGLFADTELRARIAEVERDAEAERAVARERSRIAREMHDVLAHSISVIAVQAAAGQEIARADPDKAVEVLGRIERVSRESLAELRRMLGVLREDGDHGATLRPQPGLGDVTALVEESVASGVPTELVLDGAPYDPGPGIELAAYRIVQEALTNVRKHGGRAARATVRIAYEQAGLSLEILDDGRGAASGLTATGSGHGLIGMRERVEAYGGTLAHGPRPGGGYAVRVQLPVAPADSRDDVSAPGRDPGT